VLFRSGFYSEAVVDGENWIISEEAVTKLAEQGRAVRTIRKLDGHSLLDAKCVVPMTRRIVPVLPALFVDTDNATGLVYSVPAHAPYDWLALRDLKTGDERLRAYRVKPESITETSPISIINLAGYGPFPAVDAVNALQAADQLDPKGEEATKEIYSREFHQGTMKDNCQGYSGMKVSDAKEAVLRDLTKQRLADSMYELPEKVVCRCTTKCIVKVLQDQWFLRYSDLSWKESSLKCIAAADVFPEEARQWFVESVNWIKEWPCARRVGLGTPLPWDSEWIVETLSDSTIYMAFYTISHIIRSMGIPVESLTLEAFDYIFLGAGEAASVSASCGISAKTLDSMRAEFLYWYPVDLRNSAKELVPNHLTFFIMQHVALFKPSQWPRGLGVNGMMLMEGVKMSKSKGNVIPVSIAIEEVGADAVRGTLLSSAEGMDDPDWRVKNANDMRDRIEALAPLVEKALASATDVYERPIDRWLMSTLQIRIAAVSQAIEEMKNRTAFQGAFFDVWNDLRWYLKRDSPRRETLRAYGRTWSLLLSPFLPFVAEELNAKLGGKGLVSISRWPEPEGRLADASALLGEWDVSHTIGDVKEILAVVNGQPTRASIFVAPAGRLEQFRKVAEALLAGKKEGDIIKEGLETTSPADRQAAVSLTQSIIKLCRGLGDEVFGRLLAVGVFDELEVLRAASDFIASETGLRTVDVLVYTPSAVPGKKPMNPLPLKPSIVLE
jgi:leucyl-tRNA synthetase